MRNRRTPDYRFRRKFRTFAVFFRKYLPPDVSTGCNID
ncbi:hypothetical protein OROGR_032755 [Orobanche gracilis]